MEIPATMVKDLRQATGCGVLDCRNALEAAEGDINKAVTWLRERGLARATGKIGRTAKEGLVEAYIHPGNRMGSIIEVNCESDFVARTDDFKALVHDLAMQVVASRPQYVKPEEIPADVIESEKAIYRAQVLAEGKPAHIVDKIIEGKLIKFYEEVCLMNQPFIKSDSGETVEKLIMALIGKVGENIVVRRFARFELGG